MARQTISSATWREAQADFEKGMSQADICRKHDVKSGALGNKIKRDGWRLTQDQRTILSDFKEASVNVSESFVKANESQKEEMEIEFTTILEDNELIANNRKLMKMAQGILIKNKDNFDHKTIKNLTGAVRDIEAVANPQATQKVEVNNQQNNNQMVLEIE